MGHTEHARAVPHGPACTAAHDARHKPGKPGTAIAARLEQAASLVRQGDLAAAVFTNPVSVRYLSGFYASAYSRLIAVIASREGQSVLAIPELERPIAERYGAAGAVRSYRDRAPAGADAAAAAPTPAAACAEAIESLGLRGQRLGFELGSISYADLERIRQAVAPREVVDVSSWIPRMRAIKSPAEIALIETAARVVGAARERVIAATRRGTTEIEIVRTGLDAGWAAAATEPDHVFTFFGNTVSGPRSDAGGGHDLARARAIQDGDLVFYAWGASCDGYWAMAGRTVYVGGTPPAEVQEAFRVARESTHRALDALRSGRRAGEVAVAADAVIDGSPFRDMCPGTVGAGMGMSMSEPPGLAPGVETPITPGMVLRVGHEIYLYGRGTVTCKCLVRVGEDGDLVFLIEPAQALICV